MCFKSQISKSTIYTQGSLVTLESHISISFENFETPKDERVWELEKMAEGWNKKGGGEGNGGGGGDMDCIFFNIYTFEILNFVSKQGRKGNGRVQNAGFFCRFMQDMSIAMAQSTNIFACTLY